MKKLFIFFFLILIEFSFSQSIQQCKHRFDTYLNFRGSLNSVVKFEEDAICIFDAQGKKEFAIYAHELPLMAAFFEHNTYQEQEKLIKQKGIKKYTKRQRDSLFIYIDDRKTLGKQVKKKPLQGYRVAIDPGHFATNLEDAKIEQKYLYFQKDSLNLNDSVKMFESVLTFNTAQILQKMLEDKGAKVFVTRNQNNFTSFNCTYADWIVKHKKRVLDSLLQARFLSDESFSKLMKSTDYRFFWDFFRDFDLLNRANRINQFNPHVSIVIHYNVDEKNDPWVKPSNNNFTMAFIGGVFTENNLEKMESKINFLRLLLTNQLSQSQKLAQETVLNFNKKLNITIASQLDASYLKDNCLATKSPGVFARNLILCRKINSPLVYGESLYQDNVDELEKLAVWDKVSFGVTSNQRLVKVAESYYEAVFKFLKNY